MCNPLARDAGDLEVDHRYVLFFYVLKGVSSGLKHGQTSVVPRSGAFVPAWQHFACQPPRPRAAQIRRSTRSAEGRPPVRGCERKSGPIKRWDRPAPSIQDGRPRGRFKAGGRRGRDQQLASLGQDEQVPVRYDDRPEFRPALLPFDVTSGELDTLEPHFVACVEVPIVQHWRLELRPDSVALPDRFALDVGALVVATAARSTRVCSPS